MRIQLLHYQIKLGATLFGLMLLPLATALAEDATTRTEPIPINIGLPNSNYWPAYVARELKLFEKAGFQALLLCLPVWCATDRRYEERQP